MSHEAFWYNPRRSFWECLLQSEQHEAQDDAPGRCPEKVGPSKMLRGNIHVYNYPNAPWDWNIYLCYIYHKFRWNVSKYTIHGAFGICCSIVWDIYLDTVAKKMTTTSDFQHELLMVIWIENKVQYPWWSSFQHLDWQSWRGKKHNFKNVSYSVPMYGNFDLQ